jgi:hypothetical protein
MREAWRRRPKNGRISKGGSEPRNWQTASSLFSRNATYQYLAAVFEIVMVWAKEGKAVSRAHRALHLRGFSSVREPEPFASIIRCTSDPVKVDHRTQS